MLDRKRATTNANEPPPNRSLVRRSPSNDVSLKSIFTEPTCRHIRLCLRVEPCAAQKRGNGLDSKQLGERAQSSAVLRTAGPLLERARCWGERSEDAATAETKS